MVGGGYVDGRDPADMSRVKLVGGKYVELDAELDGRSRKGQRTKDEDEKGDAHVVYPLGRLVGERPWAVSGCGTSAQDGRPSAPCCSFIVFQR